MENHSHKPFYHVIWPAHIRFYVLGMVKLPKIYPFSGRIVSNSHRCRGGGDIATPKAMDMFGRLDVDSEPPNMMNSAHGQYLNSFGPCQSYLNLSQFWVTKPLTLRSSTSQLSLCRWRPKVSSLRTLFVSTSGYQNGRDHQWPPRYELNLKLSIVHSFQDGKQTLMFFVPPKPRSAWLPFQVSSWNSMRRQQPKPSWPPDRKRCGLRWFNIARKTRWKNTLRMEESSTNGAFGCGWPWLPLPSTRYSPTCYRDLLHNSSLGVVINPIHNLYL